MSHRKYTVIFPILTTLLMLTSLSGIIGNALLLNTSSTGSRSFTVDNLDPQEIKVRSINLPSGLDKPQLSIILSDLSAGDKEINIYIADDEYPGQLSTISDFENSTYFQDDLLDFSREVERRQTFDLDRSYDELHIFFGNEGQSTVSFSVVVQIDEQFAGQLNTGRIIGIIVSAMMTALLFFLSLYLWFEYFGKIDQRLLDDDLENKLDSIQDRALSWELFVAGIGFILAITGYGQILMGNGGGNFIGAIIAAGIVYYNYTNRQKIENSIRSVLVSHGDIELAELSSLIGQPVDDTKKALLDAIMYSNLPARFDFKSKMVYYEPEEQVTNHSGLDQQQETVQESNFQVASTEVQSGTVPTAEETQTSKPLPVCAYCDTEAIISTAQFCHSCGASISSAK